MCAGHKKGSSMYRDVGSRDSFMFLITNAINYMSSALFEGKQADKTFRPLCLFIPKENPNLHIYA